MSPKIFILALLLLILVCNIHGLVSQQEAFKYIGCFKDKRARGLEKNLGKLGKVSDCVGKCRELKLNYAGMQFGGYCFCGNKHDKYGKAGNCDKKCRSGEICGGGWANSVYKVLKFPPKWELVGCFQTIYIKDHLSGLVVSVEHCFKKCLRSGFPYMGISFGFYCSCGKDFSKYKKGSACTIKCRSKEKDCGGQRFTSIYKIIAKIQDGYIQKGYIGCYKENKAKKVLPRHFGSDISGVVMCTDRCRLLRMKYAGIMDGQHCHCGNKYDTYGKATDCTKKCNTGEPCGGTSSNSVYEILKSPSRPVAIGCFEEETPKKLTKYIQPVRKMALCYEDCLNYEYFGVLNGSKCYCGNDYPKKVKSNKCTKKCKLGHLCGGVNAYSVYKVLKDN